MRRDRERPAVLAADVGGTHARLAIFAAEPAGPLLLRAETVPSDRTASVDDVLRRFVGAAPPAPRAACLAVAGPVLGGRASMTNHPWVFDAGALSAALGGIPTRVVNDLEAAAIAMPHLPSDRVVEIAPGVPGAAGNVAVVAPGTGLGCATLYWDGTRHHPLASEGGHTDFAPRSEREIALFRHLRARHDHVSYERVLSGPGIVALYTFLRESGVEAEGQALHERVAAAADPAAVIAGAAATGDALGRATLALFAEILGAKAGNLALEVLAFGGVYVGGGIPPKVLPHLRDGAMREAFLAKGRHRALLERMPLRVSLAEDAALLGAARLATDLG
jgi:glucokinase